jgi:hypothetical protein
MKQAIESAEKQLKYLVPYLNTNILFANSEWAIVGGFVRDTLISKYLGGNLLSADIDIAVIGDLPKVCLNKEIIGISNNSFGGLKIETVKYGFIDIWSVNKNQNKRTNESQWMDYLDHIDFSINSIIFTYPYQKIFMHKRWLNSFKRRLISQLNEASPSPDLQLVRALALSKTLSLKTGLSFSTNTITINRLQNLLSTGDISSYHTILNYTVDKVIKNRWPDKVLDELIDLKIASNNIQ